METGALVWARDANQLWKQGTVVNRSEKGVKRNITVRFDDGGEEAEFVLTAAQADEGEGASSIKLRNVEGQSGVVEGADIDDLVVLTHLHEPAILYTLEERYNQNKIYTYTGPILLAINPFCRVPLYTNKILEQYRKEGQLKIHDPEHVSELPPHVYAVADNAYRLMTNPPSENDKRNQSILVSGESGAGKTETTKIIMRYLAILGGHDAKAILEGDSSIISIEQQVLQSNPILEAFGNARTVRNDNSSRFGKFIEIDFDKDGFLCGAAIRTFLLEKIRLVHTSEHERNFHIFYQMIAGAPKQSRDSWKLVSDPRKYHYINQSGCYTRRDGIRDADLWSELERAMVVMGMTEGDSENVFKCTAGILNCGNLDFADNYTRNNDEPFGELVEKTKNFAEYTAELWHVGLEDLISAMTKRTIKAGRETLTVRLDASKCKHSRDALCKSIFSSVFDKLVAKINETIDRQQNSRGDGNGSSKDEKSFNWGAFTPPKGGGASYSFGCDNMFIGLLDIFGFESFEHNYFEQFLINYANEKLQQQFNHFVFDMEQEEYKKENIRWDFIEFPNNKDSIELIENRPAGILSLLDEQGIVPKANDQTLAKAFYRHLETHQKFKCGHDLKVDFRFTVQHYAGDITYETEGFLEKNQDALHPEGIALLKSSSNDFISELAEMIRAEPAIAKKSGGSQTPTPRRGKGITTNTVGMQFQNQLNNLLAVIEDTHPHYVRCLKPNDRNIKSCFDVGRITNQLANGGVLAAVHVARAGFPVRMQHSEFIARYRILFASIINRAWARVKRNTNIKSEQEYDVCKVLITECIPLLESAIPKKFDRKNVKVMDEEKQALLKKNHSFRIMCSYGGIQMGKTKIFFRQAAFNRAEKARTMCLNESAVAIQKIARGSMRYKKFQMAKKKIVVFQAHVRRRQARRRYLAARLLNATIILQTFARASTKRSIYLRKKRAALKLQTFIRCHMLRRKFLLYKNRVIILQCQYRRLCAKRQLVELKKEAAKVSALQAQIEAFERKMKEQQEAMLRAQEEAIKKALADAEAAQKAAKEERRREEAKAKAEAERLAAIEAEKAAKAMEEAKKRAEDEAAAAAIRAEIEAEKERVRAEAAAELAKERAAAEELRKMIAAQKAEQEALAKKLAEEEAARIKEEEEKARKKAELEEERQRLQEELRLKSLEEQDGRIANGNDGKFFADLCTDDLVARDSKYVPSSRGDTEQYDLDERLDVERVPRMRYNNMSSSTSRYEYNRHHGREHETKPRSRSYAHGPESYQRPPNLDENDFGYAHSVYARSITESPRSVYPESLFSDGFLEPEDLENLIVNIESAYVTQVGRSSRPYVLYRIRVKTIRHKWTVDRRFSDFLWLHEVLCEAFNANLLPTLPGKKFIGDQLDREFIEMRKLLLNNYLVSLIAQKGHWLVERNVNCVEVGIGFNRRMVKEAVAKQSFIAFLDRRQAILYRDQEPLLSTLGLSLCTMFTLNN